MSLTLFHRMLTKTHSAFFALIVAVLATIFAAILSFFMLEYAVFTQVLVSNSFVGFSVAFVMSYFVGNKVVMINYLTGELDRMASYDFLTGAQTRRKFFAQFNSDNAQSGGVIVIDMDGFKEINDSLGHAVGDQALVMVAATIKEQVGPKGHFCRMGGDEFCIFLDSVDQLSANRIAARIKRSLAEQSVDDGNIKITLGASAGIAMYRWGDDIDEVIAAADKALFVQKSRSRNRRLVATR